MNSLFDLQCRELVRRERLIIQLAIDRQPEDRQTGTKTDRQTDKQTDRPTDRPVERQTGRL